MFAASIDPKLAQYADQTWDRAFAWTLDHGITLVMTLVLTMIALKVSTLLISQLGHALQKGFNGRRGARALQRSTTLTQILRSTVRALIGFAGGMMALSELGINITPIIASVGVVGLAVGFGAQSLVKDVVSGFFVLLEDQYGIGDRVTIAGHNGRVVTMNLRITQVRDAENTLITIPNGSVGIVANHSKMEEDDEQAAAGALERRVDTALGT